MKSPRLRPGSAPRSISCAAAAGADACLVRHGVFWKNENARVTGAKKKRVALLLQQNLNLFAYHLPLDAHPELGNNVQLGALLGFNFEGWFGEQNVIARGTVAEALHLARESGVAFISADHHACERYGVQAVGAHLASRLGLAHQFIDFP